MSYSEQIRQPDAVLNPPQQKQGEQTSGVNWWKWIIILLVVKVILVILVARYRPQWLAKLGIHFGGGGGLGGINPNGWV